MLDPRPVLELKNISKRFPTHHAVKEISLELARGEFFSLLGSSGCGMTTTLRMIAGFEQPTSGQILLDGVDMTGTPPHKRHVNTVFQSYALFPHLNVYNNVAFGLRRSRVSDADVKRRVIRRTSTVPGWVSAASEVSRKAGEAAELGKVFPKDCRGFPRGR